ncbi:MAG: hypothetical protein H0U81_06255 [Pyrinomonadaceae bacterium]|nr:hypothetical protein [Pyrinomonadaceae bacterium]
MKIQSLRMGAVAFLLAATASSANLHGQTTAQGKDQAKPEQDVLVERNVIVTRQGHGEGHMPLPPDVMGIGGEGRHATAVFISSEMNFGGKVVKNAPYSAQSVSETVQALGDGNRIVRKNTAAVYRDGEGRTRRDQTLGAIGPFAAAGDPPQTFFINDPVAGVNYILDPRSRTARKLILPRWNAEQKDGAVRVVVTTDPTKKSDQKILTEDYVGTAPGVSAARTTALRRHAPGEFEMAVPAAPHGEGLGVTEFYRNPSSSDSKKESLGKQTIEGVEADGTRSTTTIPTGAIGNEAPIQIISERWYSPELQTIVMTRHSDPRFGETTFRLTNINRTEPARSLFEVPADYTVKEAPAPMIRRMRAPKPDKEK